MGDGTVDGACLVTSVMMPSMRRETRVSARESWSRTRTTAPSRLASRAAASPAAPAPMTTTLSGGTPGAPQAVAPFPHPWPRCWREQYSDTSADRGHGLQGWSAAVGFFDQLPRDRVQAPLTNECTQTPAAGAGEVKKARDGSAVANQRVLVCTRTVKLHEDVGAMSNLGGRRHIRAPTAR